MLLNQCHLLRWRHLEKCFDFGDGNVNLLHPITYLLGTWHKWSAGKTIILQIQNRKTLLLFSLIIGEWYEFVGYKKQLRYLNGVKFMSEISIFGSVFRVGGS